MIGLAILVGASVLLLVRWLELPATVMAELEVEMLSPAMTWIILLIYVLLLAIPFLPSAEIGLAVMLVLGSSMALPVYAATILGLTIAFAAGQRRICPSIAPARATPKRRRMRSPFCTRGFATGQFFGAFCDFAVWLSLP